ncbi:MAG: hypothetical protein KA941_11780 [Flavobacteriales bacterium]|nr:hypothetical protein [Flavobacteriales bacterium]
MSKHLFVLLLLCLPLGLLAQERATPAQPLNAPTLAVLLANRPAHMEQAKWLEMMQQPLNRSLYPLRITQATLDTLDGSALDRRFQYIMVQAKPPTNNEPVQ